MKIIISPAKKMQVQTEVAESAGLPYFIEDADCLRGLIKAYDRDALKQLFCANDEITDLNYRRYQEMNLHEALTPAVLSYIGLQYQSMAPHVFTKQQWEYVKGHLSIVSGLYGLLGACDGVVPYRLEMQARLATSRGKTLYEYWNDRIYRKLTRDDHVIVNLASKEYSKAVEPYLSSEDTFLTCVFAERCGDRIRVKATAAKMARGEMVRYMAKEGIETVEELKQFDHMEYRYDESRSRADEYVFVREEKGR